jgi:hypothetical protein
MIQLSEMLGECQETWEIREEAKDKLEISESMQHDEELNSKIENLRLAIVHKIMNGKQHQVRYVPRQ